MNFKNLIQVYSKLKYFIIATIATLLIATVLFHFTDFKLISGNMGLTHAISQVTIQIILSILFGLNIGILWYKLEMSAGVSSKQSGATTLGGIIGVVVSGCPACSITIASYLGLASILSSLPFMGLELKVLGILLLLYSTNSLLKNLNTCKLS